MSAANHEAPCVLVGRLHHGTRLVIDTHHTDTGGASDHVSILCAMLGIRFCPRLRDLTDRELTCIEPTGHYPDLQPLLGRRIKADVVREHWSEAGRLTARCRNLGALNALCLRSTGWKARSCAGAVMPG